MNPNNYDKESFEDKWRERLEDASYEPPSHLWEHIDAHLAKQAQQHRLVAPFYKRLSIAASLLLMALSATLWLQQKQHKQEAARLQTQIEIAKATQKPEESNIQNPKNPKTESTEAQIFVATAESLPPLHSVAPLPQESNEDFASSDKSLPAMAYQPEAIRFEPPKIAIVAFTAPKAEENLFWEEESPAPSPVKKSSKNTFWMSVDFMPIAANNNMSINYQPVIALAAGRGVHGIDASKVSEELQQQVQSQFSYQTGFQVGYRFYKGFTLQSGLHYTALQSSISTNQYIEQNGQKYPGFLTLARTDYAPQGDVMLSSANRGASPEAITINNQFQFLNIPLQIGYLFGKDKWRYGLSAGISANVLLNSTFAGGSDASVAALSMGASDEGFYKPLFLSSMASVSLQYLLSETLRVSLQPTYQQAIESVAKENSPLQSSPRIWGLNMGISYNF
jgi:hypothetical protein